MNGMFAFALWEEKSRTLLLARDRLGVKPLYYCLTDRSLVFASEIKALFLDPNVPREVNLSKLAEYFAFRWVAGEETLFKGIREVPPGHVMLLRHGMVSPRIVRYWKEGHGKGVGEYADPKRPYPDQLQELFASSIQYRLISDVPLGTFNSGGVDSSLVTAFVRPKSQGPLHTFSVGFNEPAWDERKYAEIVARQLGTEHHTLVVSEEQYAESLEKAVWHSEEPLNHPHTVQLLRLNELAKQYVTVVLTGEGSDELFGGYPRYNIPHLLGSVAGSLRLFSSPLMFLSKRLKLRRIAKMGEYLQIASNKDLALVHNSRFVPIGDYNRLWRDEPDVTERLKILKDSNGRFGSDLSRLLYLDLRSYLSCLLTRQDKMSMAASVEARVPFLDFRIVEWSWLISEKAKIRLLTNKWIVKKMAERWLPREIVYRNKVGFGVPLAVWFRNPRGLGRFLDLLCEQRSLERGYFDPVAVRAMIEEHRSAKADHSEVLWSLLNMELWHRRFIDPDSRGLFSSAGGLAEDPLQQSSKIQGPLLRSL